MTRTRKTLMMMILMNCLVDRSCTCRSMSMYLLYSSPTPASRPLTSLAPGQEKWCRQKVTGLCHSVCSTMNTLKASSVSTCR